MFQITFERCIVVGSSRTCNISYVVLFSGRPLCIILVNRRININVSTQSSRKDNL